jgi:hypothetical protein
LVSPITELAASAELVTNDLFNGYDTYAPYDMWQGIVPQFIYDGLPVISTLGYNGSYYLETLLNDLVTGPTSTLVSLGNGLFYLPGQVIDAVGQVISGDIPGALSTLVGAVVDPIAQAANSALDAASVVLGGIVTNLVNVIATVPTLAKALVDTTIGVAGVLWTAATEVAGNIVTAITSFDLEAVWNTAVEGLLGPSGFPGALEAMTLGPGSGTWDTDDYVSSFRVWAQTTMYTLANAIGGTYPPPAGSAAAVPNVSAAAVPSAADAAPVPNVSPPADASPVSAPTPDVTDDDGADTAVTPPASGGAARDRANQAGPKAIKAGDVDSTASSKPSAHTANSGTGHAKEHTTVRAAS